jgi:GAF domain-containing protein/DNA-binding response OmpR family regulator
MSKKKITNRIDSLFEDLGSEFIPDQLQAEKVAETQESDLLSGWRWSCNSDGFIQECSEEVQRILGIPPQEWLGKPLYSFDLTTDSSGRFHSEMESARQDERSFEQDVVYLSKDGHSVPVKQTVFPVMDDDAMGGGRFIGWRGVALVLQSVSTPLKETILPTQPSPALSHRSTLLQGICLQDEQILPAQQPLYPASRESMLTAQPVMKPADSQSPAVLAIPVRLQQQGLALLEILDENPSRVWSEDELRLVEQVTDQLSLALENARLFQETQSALSEMEALYNISRAATHSLQVNEVLTEMLKEVLTFTGFDCGLVSIFDEQTRQLELAVTDGLPKPLEDRLRTQGLGGTLCEWVYQKGELLIIEDNQRDAPLDTSGLVRLGLLSYIGAPLVSKGQILGTLCCFGKQPKATQDISLSLFQATSQQIGIAVENSRLYQFEQRRRQIADTLRDIARVVGSVLDIHEVTERMLDQLPNLIEFDTASIQLISQGVRRILGARGIEFEQSLTGDFDVLEAVEKDVLVSEAVQTRKPVLISDTHADPRWVLKPVKANTRSYLTAPLIAGQEVVGVLELENRRVGAYVQETAELAAAFASQAAVAIQNARLFEQIQSTLQETNALYRGSMALNSAASYEEVLAAVKDHTILGRGSHSLTLNIFNPIWDSRHPTGWIEILAAMSEDAFISTHDRFPIESFLRIGNFLKLDHPLFINDLASDERLDVAARTMLEHHATIKTVMIVPMVLVGRLIGFINASYEQPQTFPEGELRRALLLTGQAAVAVQNMRLLDETQRRAGQLETAAEIARDTSGTLALDILLNRAVNLIRDRYGYYHASFFLVDEKGEFAVVRASTGTAGEEMRRRGHKLAIGSNSIMGMVTRGGSPLVVNDVSQSSIHHKNPLLPETRAELGLPLKIGNRIIGALDVQATEVEAFSQDDIAVLQVLADQIAVAIDNARSYELAQQAVAETRQRVHELSSLYTVSSSLANATLEISEISGIITRNLVDITQVDACSVSLYHPEDDVLLVYADVEKTESEADGHIVLLENQHLGNVIQLVEHPVIDQVMQTFQAIQVNSSDAKANAIELADMKARRITSQVIFPLAVKGQAIGVIRLENRRQEIQIEAGQMNLLVTLANASAVALENARLYEEQIATSEKLRELDKLKSQFLANMSHELRTPLNSIIGFSRVIIKGIDGPITDLQQQDLTAIHNAGQHLLKLINDILDISKIEAGKMELAFDENVDLADLINSAMSTAVGLTKDKPIKLERSIPDNLPQVRADPTRIRQVLINFLSNAAKFTDEGTIRISANVQIGIYGKPEVRVSVTDSGPGISKEDQANLFQPFSQVDASPTRKVGGTGLGLSISRMLIELHKGRIGVESDTGQGSTFYFTLPLPYIEPEIEDGYSRDVLVIDDDAQIIKLYERYLQETGYRVIPLMDPFQAVAAARELKPYAITLDVMMPGRDGWQVLEELKADPETRQIPVIICSIVEDQEKGFNLGAVDYLSKPILMEDLVNSLNRLNSDGSILEVLIVDDDEDDLRLAQRILQEHTSYQVRTALGGPEGLSQIMFKPPQAIILDLFMPELDGFSLLEKLREDPTLKDIPVIIFTAGDLTQEQQQRLAEFSQKMLHKSVFSEEEFLESLEHVLKRFSPLPQNIND